MQYHSHTQTLPSGRIAITFIVILAVLIGALGWQIEPASEAQAASWDSIDKASPSNRDAIKPAVAIDSQGYAHVAYQQTNFSSDNTVYYVNNRSGKWSEPKKLGEDAVDPSVSTVTIGGTIYVDVVYGGDDLRYRRSSDGGEGFKSEEQITSHPSFAPDIVVDDTGQPHVAYTRGGKLNGSDILDIYYTTKTNDWSSPKHIGGSENVNGESQITYTHENDLIIHIVHRAQQNWGGNSGSDIKVYYARKVGGGSWDKTKIEDDYAGKPHIDSNHSKTLYLTLTRKGGGNYDFEPYFYRSTNSGDDWSSGIAVGPRTSDLSREAAIARRTSGQLLTVIADDYQGGDQQEIYGRFSSDDGKSWGSLQEIYDAGGISAEPSAAGGPRGFMAAWNDNHDGRFRIFTREYVDTNAPTVPTSTPVATSTPTVTPSPTPEPKPSFEMTLLGDMVDKTSSDVVDVQINLINGTANQYRLSNGDGNWSPYAALPSTGTVPDWLLDEATSDACVFRTVTGQVQDSTRPQFASDEVQASIQYDPGVDATVDIRNPYLSSNQQAALQDYAGGGDGASNGDPGYTRSDFYYAAVSANAGECSGLDQIQFGQIGLSYDELEAQPRQPLSGFELEDRSYEVVVTVTDGAGHTAEYNRTIIRDTEPPQIMSNTATLSVTNMLIDDTSTDSILVKLRFNGAQVSDNLYGQHPGEEQPFWGVWLANSRTLLNNPDDMNEQLDWQPVPVTHVTPSNVHEDGFDFVIENWSLFSGLQNADRTAGQYYIYARFLDGAGNVATYRLEAEESDFTLASNSITLSQNFSEPAVYLPVIRR
ncbi:MAG: hypothetical protein HC837_06870 [Chloroflexaceae bacterium]|nr:hypothetical protein [Chloroflexaceae bacterium]